MRYVMLFLLAALMVHAPAAAGTAAQPATPTPQADEPAPYCGPFLAEARASGVCFYKPTPNVFATPKAAFTPYISRPDDPEVPLDSHAYYLSNGWTSVSSSNVDIQTTPIRAIVPKATASYIGGNLLSYRAHALSECTGVGVHLVTGVALSRNQYLKFDYSQVWKQSGDMELKVPSPSVSLGFRY